MVYHATTAELDAAYADAVGCYDYHTPHQRADGQTALQLAQLQPGQSVLEIGAGSGRFIADAKQRVGAGICVAVDAVQGFLGCDIPWTLHNKNLTVYPAGTPHQQVRLLRANITDAGADAAIQAVPGAPQHFDCIVALHVFNTIPARERRPALVRLRRLLAPGGRLIVTMSARFTSAPVGAEASIPVQFRTAHHTEAPGCNILLQWRHPPSIRLPRGGPAREPKVVSAAIQLSPDRFWAVAVQQAREAADDTGFSVDAMRNVGKGDDLGLPLARHSPPQPTLDAMTDAQLGQETQSVAVGGGYACSARILQTAARRKMARLGLANQLAQDQQHALMLQDLVTRTRAKVHATNAFLPAGAVVHEAIEPTQVGVMAVLRKL